MEKLDKIKPLLRFPAFIQDGGWKEYKLGDIAQFYKGKGISKNDVTDNGTIPCIRYGELYTHYKEVIDEVTSYTDLSIDDLFMSKANDIIIPSSGETKEDIATASCVLRNNVALGGDINVIRTSNNGVFLSYYLNNAKKHDIAKIAQGISIIHLYNEQLRNLSVEIPNLEEQQKIAECLSSIDSYISSINEKVEQLKAHKKSLMQKLFPQKGQTIPEYRFPEFDNNGKWEKHILSDITSVVNDRCGANNLCIETYISTENMLPNYGGVKIASKLPVAGSFTYFMKGDVLFSNIRPYLKKVWCANFDGVTSNDIIVFRAKTGFDACFVSCILMSDAFIDYSMIGAKGVKMPRGDKDMMLNYNVYVPYLEEQQKIAECLSSIDEAIRLYSEKAFLMEQHKKGLMLQLFPTSK